MSQKVLLNWFHNTSWKIIIVMDASIDNVLKWLTQLNKYLSINVAIKAQTYGKLLSNS